MINPDNLIALIKDKEGVIKKLLDMMTRNQKQLDGCNKMRNTLIREEDPNHSQANLIKCIEVSLATNAKMSQDLLDLAQLVLIYTQGSNFTADVVKMAGKFGKGDEALRAMLEAKMKGG